MPRWLLKGHTYLNKPAADTILVDTSLLKVENAYFTFRLKKFCFLFLKELKNNAKLVLMSHYILTYMHDPLRLTLSVDVSSTD